MDQTFMHLLLSEFMGTALMIRWNRSLIRHHNMGIRYHCYFIHLRWCKYQPCYGAC